MTKQDYKYLAITACIILIWSAVMFFCVYRPLAGSIGQINEQIEENNMQLNEMADFIALHDSDLQSYQKHLAANLALLNDKFPSLMKMDDVLSQLNETAQTTKAAITSLKIRPAKTQAQTVFQDIDITLQGDYFAVLSFLRGLNLLPRTAIVRQGTVTQENNMIICNLTLQIYADNYNK